MALFQFIVAHTTRLLAILILLTAVLGPHAVIARSGPGKRRRGVPLPPGPPGRPILGHLHIPSTENPENAYAAWSEEYKSDVLYFNILGQDVVVLNSVRAAVDLLDRRGANYCDRPRFVLFEEMDWRKTLTFLRWGPEFRMHRSILRKSFSRTNIVAYRELQQREASTLVEGLMGDPTSWETALRRFATAVMMNIGFGVDVESDDDSYVQIAADASYALGHAGAPAGTPVDFFPFLTYLPNWLVRDRSLRFARDWKWAIRRLHDVPYSESFRVSMDDIKGAAGAVYAAGQDTTWATLIVLVLNMTLHPEVQKKAQVLIDEETLRWCPVSPLGVPDRSLEDDIYNGMFIPKGSVVYANARAMTQDERAYFDPGRFNPDRYSPADQGGYGEPFPVGQFGFGRRLPFLAA
ncbi:cytochrome P450 [Colletotrichum navitas]|uniref:Cytochrome P450 n=1 Tax=Colletotrichum navitas TaxID=681940 RepID=A0AAD8Q1G6_9PEZI|nr:cytochrome P450 [Colletotrichum navitas]KAK1593713.1 cytochrome P450 [Colletotrichum navitas]